MVLSARTCPRRPLARGYLHNQATHTGMSKARLKCSTHWGIGSYDPQKVNILVRGLWESYWTWRRSRRC